LRLLATIERAADPLSVLCVALGVYKLGQAGSHDVSGSRPARGDARPRRTRRLGLLELTPDQTARQGYKQVSLKHPLARSDKS
jgi:hypothetical protein